MTTTSDDNVVHDDAVVEILSNRVCGFCLLGTHINCCIRTTPFYNKVWVCPCDCDKSVVVKPKGPGDWWKKYSKENYPRTEKKKRTTATNNPSTVTYVAPKPAPRKPAPRDARVDALASEMLDDVRTHEEFKKEKEKWES